MFLSRPRGRKETVCGEYAGALLKQLAGSFKQIPKEIQDAFEKHKKVTGGRALQLSEIVKLLGTLWSIRPTFFCLDALDECAALHRAKILLSLKKIIKVSPAALVFLIGRPHVEGEVGKHLPIGATLVSVSPQKDDIVRYIHGKLAEDTISDEMGEGLEAEIVKKIPENIGEM